MGKDKLTTAPWDKDISAFLRASFCETFWWVQRQGVCLRKTNVSNHVDIWFQYTSTPSCKISKHIVESCQHFPEKQILTFNFIAKQLHFKNQTTTKTSMRQAITNAGISHAFVVNTKIVFLVVL